MDDKEKENGFDPNGIIERTGGRRRKLQAYSPVQAETIMQEPAQQEIPEDDTATEYTSMEPDPVKEKEAPKRKRNQGTSYKETYVKRNEMKTRQCVYISHDVHAVIAKLVRALVDAGNDISVGGYIDTVLNEHLQLHKEEINEVSLRSLISCS